MGGIEAGAGLVGIEISVADDEGMGVALLEFS